MRKYVMCVLRNVKSTLNTEWSIADVVLKLVEDVLRNAGLWLALMLKLYTKPLFNRQGLFYVKK